MAIIKTINVLAPLLILCILSLYFHIFIGGNLMSKQKVVYNITMKSLSVILLLTTSLNLLACQFSVVEQDSRFYLVLKRIGDLPADKEKFAKKLRRGLQEVDVSSAEKEKRKVRVKVLYDSDDREKLEQIVKTRCTN